MIITRDESWIFEHDPSGNQKAEHGVEEVGKVHQKSAHVKIENQNFGYHVLRYPCDNSEALGTRRQTVNAVYYTEVLKQLW